MSNSLGNKEIMAENLQRYMDKYGEDRNTLAIITGTSYFTVTAWLKARTYPRIDKIELLARHWHISKSDLVERQSDTQTEKTPSSTQLDKMLDEAIYWQGKVISNKDRAIIKAQLAAYFENKDVEDEK